MALPACPPVSSEWLQSVRSPWLQHECVRCEEQPAACSCRAIERHPLRPRKGHMCAIRRPQWLWRMETFWTRFCPDSDDHAQNGHLPIYSGRTLNFSSLLHSGIGSSLQISGVGPAGPLAPSKANTKRPNTVSGLRCGKRSHTG